jgi:hypothetical protein
LKSEGRATRPSFFGATRRYFFEGVPTQKPGLPGLPDWHRLPGGQSMDSSQGILCTLFALFGIGVPTQTPGLPLYLWLHLEPAGQSLDVSHGLPAVLPGAAAGVPTQTPGLVGSGLSQREPDAQSLELSQGTASAAPGNAPTTNAVTAARTIDRSGLIMVTP